eukprot:2092620-Karenia_brevis.AAC.1
MEHKFGTKEQIKEVESMFCQLRTIPAEIPFGAIRNKVWIAELSYDTGVDFPFEAGQYVSMRED